MKEETKENIREELWNLLGIILYDHMEEHDMDEISFPLAVELIQKKLEEELAPPWDLMTKYAPPEK